MANINDVIRRTSTLIDTSGHYPPNVTALVPGGVQGNAGRGGVGVYVGSDNVTTDSNDLLSGRITLGIIAVFIAGALAFYIWTREIQGGG